MAKPKTYAQAIALQEELTSKLSSLQEDTENDNNKAITKIEAQISDVTELIKSFQKETAFELSEDLKKTISDSDLDEYSQKFQEAAKLFPGKTVVVYAYKYNQSTEELSVVIHTMETGFKKVAV